MAGSPSNQEISDLKGKNMSTIVISNPNIVDEILSLVKSKPQGFDGNNRKPVSNSKKRKIDKTQYLSQLTDEVNKLSNNIPKRWKSLSSEQKNSLKKFAYSFIDSSKKLSFFRFLSVLPKIIWLRLTTDFNVLILLNEALCGLADSILDRVESDDIYYQEVLNTTFIQLSSDPVVSKEIKLGETSGWLRSLSNKAITEI